MKKILMTGLVFLVILSLSISQESPIIEREGGSIKIDNDNYRIFWELEVTGHTPYDEGKFILEGIELISKGIDRTVDIAIISPDKFLSGSKAYMWRDVIDITKVQRSFSCPTPLYGWIEVGSSFYCTYNHTIIPSGEIEEVTSIVDITPEYSLNLEDHPNNASITWNITIEKTSLNMINVTGNINYINKATQYGDHVYYVKDATFKADKPHRFRFELSVNETGLPLKYTICFGDISANQLYFCLDPTITTSRTWTTNTDFINGTLRSNLTTTNDDIRLDGIPTDDLMANWQNSESGWIDKANFKYNGTLTGSPAYQANIGVYDGSYKFTAGEYVDIQSLTDFKNTGNAVSIEFWVNITQEVAGQYPTLFIFEETGDNDRIVYYVSANNDRIDAYHRWNGGGSTHSFNSNADGVRPGLWTHYVLVMETTRHRLFINGALNKNDTSASVVPNLLTGLDMFRICSRGAATEDCSEVLDFGTYRVWNRSLTPEEITTLYNSGSGMPTTYSRGKYEDRQKWSPQAGNQITNISIEMTTSGTQTVNFYYNKTNTSLDTSAGTTISTSGTNNIDLDLGNDEDIYYKFIIDDDGYSTPQITSYTINEATVAGGSTGTLTATLKSPTANANHSQNTLIIYQLNVSCSGGTCSDVNVTIDPEIKLNQSDTDYSTGITNIPVSGTWGDARNETNGSATDVNGVFSVESEYNSGLEGYLIRRMFFVYNGTPIPDNADISKTDLCIYPTYLENDDNDGDDYIAILEAAPSDFTNIGTLDYNETGMPNPTEISDQIDISDMSVENWYCLNFTSTGIATVNVSGIMTYAMLEGHDILDSVVAGADTSNTVRIWVNDNATIESFLNVTYTIPSSTKSGAISTTAGTTPFFTTNTSNPTNVCGTMSDGDTCIIGFEVNATGDEATTHEFFWIVESTDSTNVNSSRINITIDGGEAAADSCTPPGAGSEWEIDGDDCIKTSDNINIGTGALKIINSGSLTLINTPMELGKLNLSSGSFINVSGTSKLNFTIT